MDAHASGSSAMPQKRNPFATMKTAVGARVVTGATASLLMSPPPRGPRARPPPARDRA
ncbi:MAG: hypothetical protein KH937_03385 [Actinomyces urogenitalis]|nr:hypothetical protein [Actinomyces urogenitalis]